MTINFEVFLKELQSLLDLNIVNSFTELAISFFTFMPGVSIVIPGSKTIEQLEENVSAIKKGPLPVEAIKLIESFRFKYLNILMPL